MKKETARELVNHLTPQTVAALILYADEHIERAKTNLSFAGHMEDVRREQGMIRAMEELKKIRDIAVGVLQKEK